MTITGRSPIGGAAVWEEVTVGFGDDLVGVGVGDLVGVGFLATTIDDGEGAGAGVDVDAAAEVITALDCAVADGAVELVQAVRVLRLQATSAMPAIDRRRP